MKSKILVFLLSHNKGWILEAKMRESALASQAKIKIIFIPTRKKDLFNIPQVIRYIINKKVIKPSIFINQNSFFKLRLNKSIKFDPALSKVFYTHYTDVGIQKIVYGSMLNECKKVFVNNQKVKIQLVNMGVNENKIEVVYGAVDRDIFFPKSEITSKTFKSEEAPYVLIAGHCKIRKNPDLIFQVINTMCDLNFIIHGEGWRKHLIDKKSNMPSNLKIFNFQMSKQPKLVRNASTYLTLSTLESGPYTTLEALASGTPVVATDTGWNSEFINYDNGVLVPINASIDEVTSAIRQTITMKKNVGTDDLLGGKYTWKELGQKLYF